MKHLKTYEEGSDEIWNKLSKMTDKDSPEYLELLSKQLRADDEFDKYKYKYLIIEHYYPYYQKTRLELVKCISVFLNHMHAEIYVKELNKYNKYTNDIKMQDIKILYSFNKFKEAEKFFESIQKYNL